MFPKQLVAARHGTGDRVLDRQHAELDLAAGEGRGDGIERRIAARVRAGNEPLRGNVAEGAAMTLIRDGRHMQRLLPERAERRACIRSVRIAGAGDGEIPRERRTRLRRTS